jgi:hypothetical protein
MNEFNDIVDLSTDKAILEETKSFLNQICKKVLDMNEVHVKRNEFRSLTEKLFYKHFIDNYQIKFFVYKLNEFKMKQVEELNYLKFEEREKKLYDEARSTAGTLIQSSIKNTVTNYKKYTSKILPIVIKVQAAFKGHLTRLITKMELMNQKLNLEQEKAVIRARAKTQKEKVDTQ